MKSTSSRRPLVGVLAVAIALGLLLPAHAQSTSSSPEKQSIKASRVPDVRLTPRGDVFGAVVGREGNPLRDASLTVLRSGTPQPLARAKTDEHGNFRLAGLAPGVYLLQVNGGYATTVRVWDAQMAPPSARDRLLVVIGAGTVRGQRPVGEVLTIDDRLVIGGMVAAAIAIPIAIASSDKDVTPISP